MDESFSEDDVKSCRNAIITFIINAAATKLPFAERDIMMAIEKKGKLYKAAFAQAESTLKDIYGILLASVQPGKGPKCYISYNRDPIKSLLVYDEMQQRDLTLLFVVLSYIFMTNTSGPNAVNEERLEIFLKGLDIHFDSDHEYFGSNVKKLITDTFVKQMYLKREKYDSELEGVVKYNYSWGFRADIEFDKKLVLNAAAQILNKPSNMFINQYEAAYGADNPAK